MRSSVWNDGGLINDDRIAAYKAVAIDLKADFWW